MNGALYNEIEPFAADWLQGLAERGHIASGRVERRSITELSAADVAGPGQRHFFAGIGGWSYALRRAGVHDDANVWTGSCPCQPFSSAGRQRGFDDERHLWPAWFSLIRECKPPVIFGEQVAGPAGLAWLDAVQADLEGCDYSVGAAVLSAAGVGAPHIRHRIYFVAYANEARRSELGLAQRGSDGELADTRSERREAGQGVDAERAVRSGSGRNGARVDVAARLMADTSMHERGSRRGRAEMEGRAVDGRPTEQSPGRRDVGGPWDSVEWVPCSDGVSRPVEPGTFPLAHGVPARVGRLRGYGNAIVTETAIEFIRAALEAIGEQ